MIYIVDDEPAVRRALDRLLRASGYEVTVFDSASDFLANKPDASPACLVLDIAMPGLSGLEVQEALAGENSLLPIIFLTGRADVPMCATAMKRGAVDFLTKPVKDSDLIAAVDRALDLSRHRHQQREECLGIDERLARLTPREREVLELVVTGLLNKQIAAQLGIAEKTIKVHRGRVMEKMSVKSVAELVGLMDRLKMR
ncbi:MAG: DNA-binding response regulator [Verrucomicrobia bacterium 61-8]|nr:MAG: DNA-binding response regulator [Verrucomicrobia bacterium 61-8]